MSSISYTNMCAETLWNLCVLKRSAIGRWFISGSKDHEKNGLIYINFEPHLARFQLQAELNLNKRNTCNQNIDLEDFIFWFYLCIYYQKVWLGSSKVATFIIFYANFTFRILNIYCLFLINEMFFRFFFLHFAHRNSQLPDYWFKQQKKKTQFVTINS